MNLQKSLLNFALAGILTVSAASAAITVGTSLSQGIVGQPYLTSLTATGGTAPYTHTLSGSTLPAGLALAVVRFALLALDVRPALVASVCLHGPLFVIFYLTCQVYLEQRVDPRIRTQSQALLSLMNNGVGNALGYVCLHWWMQQCSRGGSVDWPRFWSVPGVAAAALTVLFVAGYKGQRRATPHGGVM